MRACRPLALVFLATLALSADLSAQARVPGRAGISTGRVVVSPPGSRPSRPPVHRPVQPIGILPPLQGARPHPPRVFRSSLFGLVAFDPYWWLDQPIVNPDMPPYAMPPQGPILTGGLQLDVEPRRALVYVDGVLAGTVDQFKGYFQHLETTAGFHVIDFLTPDYEPLSIGVTVVPNQTTTYRGFLSRASGR